MRKSQERSGRVTAFPFSYEARQLTLPSCFDPLSLRLTEALAKNGVVDLGTGVIAILKDQRKLITDGDDLEAKSGSGLLVSLRGAGEDAGDSRHFSGRRLHQ